MREVDSTSEGGIEHTDFRHSIENASPSVGADGELAAYIQALGRSCGNRVEDDRANRRDACLEEFCDLGVHPQRYEALELRVRDGVDIDGQFARARVDAGVKEGGVIDGVAPRKIVLDKVHESLDLRDVFNVSAVDFDVDKGRKNNVGNDGGAIIGSAV